MNCTGIDATTGTPVSVEFGDHIERVQPLDTYSDELYVAPGFIDIQVNGFLGIDFNNPQTTVGEICRAVDAMVATGVTRCLPTVITGGPEDMLACLRNLREAQKVMPVIAGFHVEGPHIGPDDGPRGAHPARWVRQPETAEYDRWQEATGDNIRLVTVSPHWPKAPSYIQHAVGRGTTVSIGHTGATAEQIEAAVEAGATLSTHLGNGAHAVMRRHPNYIWDQLAEDRLSASFIADGIHLGQAYLRVALRAKSVNRSILVTDAAAPAGAQPGRYLLGEQEVVLTPDDRVMLTGTEKLAGSALKMNRGVANMVQLGGLTLRDAIFTATVNPARCIRLKGRERGLEAGELADLVTFRYDGRNLSIEDVFVSGNRVRTGESATAVLSS